MADIQTYINNILNAVYGEEVRASLVNALAKINADNEKYLAIKQEVVKAKDTVVDQIVAFDEKHDKALQTIADLLKVASDAAVMQGELQTATNAAERKKGELDEAVNDATSKITDVIKVQDTLRATITTAVQTKEDLAASNAAGAQTKTDLDAAIKAANLVVEKIGNTLTKIDTTAEEQLTAIRNAGAEETEKVQQATEGFADAARKAVQEITDTGTAQTAAVNSAGVSQIAAIDSAGSVQLQNIRTAGTEETEKVQLAAAEIVADRQQIQQNKKDAAKLKDDLTGKLDKRQGTENAGKALVIGEDGNVVPGEVQSGGGATEKFTGMEKLAGGTISIGTQANTVVDTGISMTEFKKWKRVIFLLRSAKTNGNLSIGFGFVNNSGITNASANINIIYEKIDEYFYKIKVSGTNTAAYARPKLGKIDQYTKTLWDNGVLAVPDSMYTELYMDIRSSVNAEAFEDTSTHHIKLWQEIASDISWEMWGITK